MPSAVVPIMLVSLVALPPESGAQQPNKTMTVFVTMGQGVDEGNATEAVRKQHSAAITAAGTTRKDLEKALKAQHGSKRDRWPEEAVQRLLDAEDAVALATSNWTYRRGGKGRIADSVEDIKKSMKGMGLASKKTHIVVVPSSDEAQLVVEVEGRREVNLEDEDLANDEFWVRIAIKRGPKLSETQFLAVSRQYQFRSGYPTTRLGSPQPDAPYWRFETCGMLLWATASKGVAGLIEDFIAKNYEAMVAAP